LSVAGCGIRLAGHLTAETEYLVRAADRVFAHAGDALAQGVLERLAGYVHPLQAYYATGTCRDESYEAMVEAILDPVRAGEKVCAVFYGHPGVFVWPAHEAVRRARREGFEATMYPGISAEDCLFADLGVDPAVSGCQSYEATDFLLHARRIDPSAALILWQPAALGDVSRSGFATDPAWVRALAGVLMADYPRSHPVTVYEAAAFPLDRPRTEEVALARLHEVAFSQVSTLYIPPAGVPSLSADRLELLGIGEDDITLGAFQHHRNRGN
ncbi:MAG: SAM-dependent methyltransferase, partial [Wenzhouxiangella sp.]